MEESKIRIAIYDNRGSVLLDNLSTFAVFVSIIGIGIFLNSSAMQWIGAICCFLIIMAKSERLTKNFTVAEAKAYLEMLEKVGAI